MSLPPRAIYKLALVCLFVCLLVSCLFFLLCDLGPTTIESWWVNEIKETSAGQDPGQSEHLVFASLSPSSVGV